MVDKRERLRKSVTISVDGKKKRVLRIDAGNNKPFTFRYDKQSEDQSKRIIFLVWMAECLKGKCQPVYSHYFKTKDLNGRNWRLGKAESGQEISIDVTMSGEVPDGAVIILCVQEYEEDGEVDEEECLKRWCGGDIIDIEQRDDIACFKLKIKPASKSGDQPDKHEQFHLLKATSREEQLQNEPKVSATKNKKSANTPGWFERLRSVLADWWPFLVLAAVLVFSVYAINKFLKKSSAEGEIIERESFNRFQVSKKFNTSDMMFWIEFRTTQPDGVLLAWPNKNWRNYFLVQLENGIVVLRTKSSKMAVEASGSSDSAIHLADGQWHTISILKKKRQISMDIDGKDNTIIKNVPEKTNLKIKGGLVIGAVPKRLSRRSIMTFVNFEGCIRNFSINSEIQKLVGVKGQRGVYPCYEPQPEGIYFPGDGFVRFDKGTELGLSVVEMEFRSDNTSEGILMMATIPYAEAGYFSIELHNGQVRAVIKPPGNGAGGQESILESVSPKELCDNTWHRVRAEIIGLKFSLRVDEEATKIGSLSKEILSFLLNVPVYFGGLEPSEKIQNSLQLPTKTFKGCLRDVSINMEPVKWPLAAVRKRAVVNGCPVQ